MSQLIALFCLVHFIALPVRGQSVTYFDYAIESVRLFEISQKSGERTEVLDLGAYMYDVGPAPIFQFDIEIEQLLNPSPIAGHANIHVEQYMLLASKEAHAFSNLDSLYADVTAPEAFWTFQSPVDLSFTCSQQTALVVCTTSSTTPQFMDPENPLTYASPHAYHLLGYAYRFILEPSSIRVQDQDMTNNAYQVTFMKR